MFVDERCQLLVHLARTGFDSVDGHVAGHEFVGVDRCRQTCDQADETDAAADAHRAQRYVEILPSDGLDHMVDTATVGPVHDIVRDVVVTVVDGVFYT